MRLVMVAASGQPACLVPPLLGRLLRADPAWPRPAGRCAARDVFAGCAAPHGRADPGLVLVPHGLMTVVCGRAVLVRSRGSDSGADSRRPCRAMTGDRTDDAVQPADRPACCSWCDGGSCVSHALLLCSSMPDAVLRAAAWAARAAHGLPCRRCATCCRSPCFALAAGRSARRGDAWWWPWSRPCSGWWRRGQPGAGGRGACWRACASPPC